MFCYFGTAQNVAKHAGAPAATVTIDETQVREVALGDGRARAKATALGPQRAIVVNIWSRSRRNQAVLDGTPVTPGTTSDLRKCWSERCPCLP